MGNLNGNVVIFTQNLHHHAHVTGASERRDHPMHTVTVSLYSDVQSKTQAVVLQVLRAMLCIMTEMIRGDE